MCRFISLLSVLLFSISGYAQMEQLQDSKTKKVGFINPNGDWIISPQYDEAEDFYEREYTFVKKKNKWAVIDRQGKNVLAFEYEKPTGDDGTLLRFVAKAGKHGMIDLETGTEKIQCIYDVPLEFQLDAGTLDQIRIIAIKNNKAGIIDQTGKVLISCSYDVTENTFERVEIGGIIALKDNKAGVIDESEKILVPFVYDEVTMSFSSAGWYHVKKNKKHGMYAPDQKREIAAPVYDDEISFDDKLALVSKKKKFGVINLEGKEVVPCSYSRSDAYEKMALLEN